MPLYFACVPGVGPSEFLLHRILWSAALLALLLSLLGRWRALRDAFFVPRTRFLLLASTAFIAANWFLFLYGVASRQVLQTSLGYFINPLFNAALGVLLLDERLRAAQWLALAIATAGIAWIFASVGQLPWIALGVASSFSLYGLARKLAPVDGLVGLAAETLLLAPLALVLLAAWLAQGSAAFLALDRFTDAMLVASGIVTVVPLWFFVMAAKRLALTTLGFLQFLGPTLQFLAAVLVLKEKPATAVLVGFCCVWTALAVITADSLLRRRAAAP